MSFFGKPDGRAGSVLKIMELQQDDESGPQEQRAIELRFTMTGPIRKGEVKSIERPYVSSKLPSHRSKNDFYRYYAGYPLRFAEWALVELGLPPGASIIDPWNGSGTTAVACARAGILCQGYDINPVMAHLGRARIASRLDFEEAGEFISTLDKIFESYELIDFASAGLAFRELPSENKTARSIALVALFPYARDLLGIEKTKNPSWYKINAKFDQSPIARKNFFLSWKNLLEELLLWRNFQEEYSSTFASVERGDSRKSLGRRDAFDGFLTSPPYLTRLDYVQATMPELLLLHDFDVAPNVRRLRRSMLGSPLTTRRPSSSVDRLPPSIKELLARIKEHPSKASATYYYRFFSTYFVDLQASMRNLAKVLKSGAVGCMVVQSSHYKEIEVDLVDAIIAIGEEVGLQNYLIAEFASRRSISLVNSRAHAEARKPKCEFAVFLRKR
jgi:hypothetical protein